MRAILTILVLFLLGVELSAQTAGQWTIVRKKLVGDGNTIMAATPINGWLAAVDGSGNLTFVAPGATAWGSITGTLSNQTDLNTALGLKAPAANPTFSGTITTPLTASRAVVTGASSQLAASAATATEVGYLSGVTSAIQTQLNGKQSTLTFGTGLTEAAGTVTVNTSQNIATLSNLTSNGFVKTTGGTGALSVDTNTYLTANQTITLSGDVSGSGTTSITTTIGNGEVTNDMLAGSIAYGKLSLAGAIQNSDLLNPSITIAGNVVPLGGNIPGSTILDDVGTTRGSILYRGAAGWFILTPGTSGHALTSQGAGADPIYAAVGISDGDKGDITVAGSGASWTIDDGSVTDSDLAGSISASKISGTALTLGGGTLSGALNVINGTTAAPSIVWSGRGTNWGFCAPSASDMRWVVAGNTVIQAWNDGSAYFHSALGIFFGSGGDLNIVREGAAIQQQGADAASEVTQAIKAHDGVGTNINGADLNAAGGQSTGTGRGGDFIIKTSTTSGSGSTANAYTTREYHSAKQVNLTESSDTTFCNVALASSKYVGLRLQATVTANDGTDFQSLTSEVTVDAVNKAGAVTATIQDTPNSGGAASSSVSTLACVYTAVANGNSVDIKANAVSSLTQTVLTVKWSILSLNTDATDTTIKSGNIVTPQ